MQKAAVLVSLLLLGWMWTLQGLPTLPEHLHPPQENFDITQRERRDVVPSLATADVEDLGDNTPSLNGTVACTEAPDTGPCFGLLHRYYYNSTSMSCELFKYGGCLGNQNNYESERECLQRCRTEAACRLPMAAQPCTGQPLIWAFNSSIGRCVPYKEGFCQGNGNKFSNKSECEEYCGVVQDVACTEAPDTGPCFGLFQRYFYNSTSMSCELFKYGGCLGNRNNYESERECLQRCRTEGDDLQKSE